MGKTRSGTLVRNETGADGTFGKLTLDSGWVCYTGELPWRGNAKGKSCIPAGVYLFAIVSSPKHGRVYQEFDDPDTLEKEDVPDRENIQIHAANYCGDSDLGFKCDLLGCIAPGFLVDQLDGQKAVLSSKKALAALEKELAGARLKLTVTWAIGIGPQEA